MPHLDSTLNASGQQDLRCNYSAAVFNLYSDNHRFDEVAYLLLGGAAANGRDRPPWPCQADRGFSANRRGESPPHSSAHAAGFPFRFTILLSFPFPQERKTCCDVPALVEYFHCLLDPLGKPAQPSLYGIEVVLQGVASGRCGQDVPRASVRRGTEVWHAQKLHTGRSCTALSRHDFAPLGELYASPSPLSTRTRVEPCPSYTMPVNKLAMALAAGAGGDPTPCPCRLRPVEVLTGNDDGEVVGDRRPDRLAVSDGPVCGWYSP